MQVADFRTLQENIRKFVERFFEPRGIDRLAEIIVCAAFDGVNRGVYGIAAGYKNNVYARIVLESLFEERQSVHFRHLEIGEDNAAFSQTDFLQRLLRASGACGRKSSFLEAHRCRPQVGRLLVEYAYRDMFSSYCDSGSFHGCDHRMSSKAMPVPESMVS